MPEFWTTTWGDAATIIGVVISLGGLGWAIWEAHGAKAASVAAELAAREAREQIARYLQVMDLQRAIGLIERIKTLHDNRRWEASTEHYQALREMLSDIISRSPDSQTRVRERLNTARANVREMEDVIRSRVGQDISDPYRARFNRSLNDIQSDLEELASGMGLALAQGEIG